MFNFLMKKLIKSKMKDVPPEQQEMVMALVEKNPQLFMKIAQEIQEKVKSGKEQMAAAMEVMQKYQKEIAEVQAQIKK
ncbi:MAG: hypothetical protein RLY57_69 [Candidatus Parcubacteria bacterium]